MADTAVEIEPAGNDQIAIDGEVRARAELRDPVPVPELACAVQPGGERRRQHAIEGEPLAIGTEREGNELEMLVALARPRRGRGVVEHETVDRAQADPGGGEVLGGERALLLLVLARDDQEMTIDQVVLVEQADVRGRDRADQERRIVGRQERRPRRADDDAPRLRCGLRLLGRATEPRSQHADDERDPTIDDDLLPALELEARAGRARRDEALGDARRKLGR